jgi:hypothetical protein
MQTKRLEQRVLEYSARTESDVDLRGRALRGAELLPVTGRGPWAALLESQHVAAFLLSLAPSKASQAADVAVEYRDMRLLDAPGFGGAATLGAALIAALSDPVLALSVHEVVLSIDGGGDKKHSEIVWRKPGETAKGPASQRSIYLPRKAVNALRGGGEAWHFNTSRIREATIIGGGLIQMLAMDLAEKEDRLGRRAAKWEE